MKYMLICACAQERLTQYSALRVNMMGNSSCYIQTKHFGNINYYYILESFDVKSTFFLKSDTMWDIDRVRSSCQELWTRFCFGKDLASEKKKYLSNI